MKPLRHMALRQSENRFKLITNQLLYQLSYNGIPTVCGHIEQKTVSLNAPRKSLKLLQTAFSLRQRRAVYQRIDFIAKKTSL